MRGFITMTRSISGLRFDNLLAGLENYQNDEFNFSVPAHTLTAGAVNKYQTTWPINNSNAISGIQLNYGGLETVWRYASGAVTLTFGGGTYQIETVTYYLGSDLHVETYTINLTGGNVNVPAFSVNIRDSLYNAPF